MLHYPLGGNHLWGFLYFCTFFELKMPLFQAIFRGCVYSKQPWKTEIVSPGSKGQVCFHPL